MIGLRGYCFDQGIIAKNAIDNGQFGFLKLNNVTKAHPLFQKTIQK